MGTASTSAILLVAFGQSFILNIQTDLAGLLDFDKMTSRPFSTFSIVSLLLLSLPCRADRILKTSGFSTCLSGSNITVQRLDIQYDADTMQVTFNVAGTSATVQNVTAQLNVTAYGTSVYQNSFNPCK